MYVGGGEMAPRVSIKSPIGNRVKQKDQPPTTAVIARPKAVAISTAAVGRADRHINIEKSGYTMLIGVIGIET